MIVLEDVEFRYSRRPKRVIQGLSCEWSSRGISVVVGRSGVGKSTLIALLAGIFVDTDNLIGHLSGFISIDGSAPATLRGANLVGWVPQQPVLLEHLNVIENVLLPTKLLQVNRPVIVKRCEDLLDRLGLGDSTHLRPCELSGGMQTRVSLARALVAEPRYLFLDEPFSGLDLFSRWRLYEILEEERLAAPLVTIATTHNVAEAMAFGDRLICLQDTPLTTAIPRENADPPMRRLAAPEALAEARRRAASLEAELFALGSWASS